MYVSKRAANVLAVCISSCIVIAVTIYLTIDYSAATIFAWKYRVFNSKPKMLLVWKNGLGERELGARIMLVMPKLGVNVKFVRDNPWVHETFFDRHVADHAERAAKAMQPDFILTIDRTIAPLPHTAPNYLVLDQGPATYIAQDGSKAEFINPMHYEFTGLLPAFKEIDLLKTVYEASGKPYQGFRWAPTVHSNNYKFQGAHSVFYPGGACMDETRNSDKYKQMFSLLDQTGYMEIYGWKNRWLHTPNSYKGFIPTDGVSILKINNAAGISLVLHAHEHFASATPTGRIFEAAAANTVIISDRHPFVVENFGDNVLYIDVSQDAQGMFKQIDEHVQWIKTHPAEAQHMAERCHEIFLKKFTLEEQMQRLLDLAMKNN